ncbi:molybdenum cofactor biosysynthesis protein [Kribbella sp. NPDC051952]|uniref:molybdenum cofactor biosysynthesis protein n=1 Tax=Kribbella sp. NPDC051952 TaxID=3154851 RepID=UPI003441154D
MGIPVEVVGLVVSRVHAFDGRPDDGPRPDPEPVGRAEIEIKAELGIVGDRYFGQTVHRNAAVTFVDAASLDQLARDLELPAVPDPLLMRRNVVLRGFPIDTLAAHRTSAGVRVPGRRFTLDTGSGPITFQAKRAASPCAWMNVVLAPGAHQALRRHGGIRSTPLTSGTLRVGPATLALLD